MAWLSFLKSKDFDPTAFEKELSALSSKISRNERTVTSFKYQERQSKSFIIIYGTLLYLLVIAYLLVKNGLAVSSYTHGETATIIGTPVLAILITKFITFYYNKRITRLESHIEHLRSQHESKIEDLKAKTNFQSTQALLNRFADGNDLNAKLDDELLEKQRQLEELKRLSLEGNNEAQRFDAYQGVAVEHHWYDFIIDLVVGTDELRPNNRYALICHNCSSHNGLAPPGMRPEYVKYICPRCGVLNGKDGAPKVIVENVDEPEEDGGENQDENQDTNHDENQDEA